MAMKFYVYDDETKANEDAKTIYYNELKKIADSHSGKIISNPSTQAQSDFNTYTVDTSQSLKIFGTKNGQKNYVDGYTSQIVAVNKKYNDTKWYFTCDSTVYDMTNADQYIETKNSLPTDWFDPTDNTQDGKN